MKTIHKEIPFQTEHTLTREMFTDSSLFFDIETTGFSPAHTSLYLIGCVRRSGSYICIDQFFAEKPAEEKLILVAFLELMKTCDTIITFNGIGFDIPYLKAKCDAYSLTQHFADYTYVDIFKSISSIKHILKLQNFKQKSIEAFLGIDRRDLYSGGELIHIYHSYVSEPEEELLELLLLHNYEDVLGMIDLLEILSYVHLMNGRFSRVSCEICDLITYEGNAAKELQLTLQLEFPVPRRISYAWGPLYLSAYRDSCRITARLSEGELKYFFPNYRDYYYLPDEDMAVHKSVSSYVDKDHREQAKASNCYSRHTGIFAPQYEEIITPSFKQEYKEKTFYFEVTDKFLSSRELSEAYTRHLLTCLKSGRKPVLSHTGID